MCQLGHSLVLHKVIVCLDEETPQVWCCVGCQRGMGTGEIVFGHTRLAGSPTNSSRAILQIKICVVCHDSSVDVAHPIGTQANRSAPSYRHTMAASFTQYCRSSLPRCDS